MLSIFKHQSDSSFDKGYRWMYSKLRFVYIIRKVLLVLALLILAPIVPYVCFQHFCFDTDVWVAVGNYFYLLLSSILMVAALCLGIYYYTVHTDKIAAFIDKIFPPL